jgi:hypothetical protein
MFEAELGEVFESSDAAMFFSERGTFNLGEVLEPSDSGGADRFVPLVCQNMRALEVIAVKEPLRLGAMLFKKTNASDRACMKPLFLRRNYREFKRIMTAAFTLS